MLIKVWCEYAFNGQFGGNCDEDVWELHAPFGNIDKSVQTKLAAIVGCTKEELEGLCGWSVVHPVQLEVSDV